MSNSGVTMKSSSNVNDNKKSNNSNSNSNSNSSSSKTPPTSSSGGGGTGNKKRGKSTVSNKPVHPLSISTFPPTGCELSVWAYLTLPRPNNNNNNDNNDNNDNNSNTSPSPYLPNLITAHASSLKIYVVDPCSGTLVLAAAYDNLAGTIVTLHALPRAAGRRATESDGPQAGRELVYDGLLLGFAGHPRLSIVYPPGSGIPNDCGGGTAATTTAFSPTATAADATAAHPSNSDDASSESSPAPPSPLTPPASPPPPSWSGVLTASSIIDLTQPLVERCWGSVTPLEQDLLCTVTHISDSHDLPTVAVVLGGGVAVALLHLPRTPVSHSTDVWWRTAAEPFLLPLSSLSSSLSSPRGTSTPSASSVQLSLSTNPSTATPRATTTTRPAPTSTFTHGFGDILSAAFLTDYTEPLLLLLHSNPTRHGGHAWSGRLAHRSSSTRTPLSLTAVSVSIAQRRAVVLWSRRDGMPADAFRVETHVGGGGGGGGCVVLGCNEVVYVDRAGRVECALGVNGWVRGTGSSVLMGRLGGAGGVGGGVGVVGGLMQPNPSPLGKLSLQLDGCRMVFVAGDVALVSLRDGSLYCLEIHYGRGRGGGGGGGGGIGGVGGGGGGMCMSLSPVGFGLGAVGRVSTLSALPLMTVPTMKSMEFLDDGLAAGKKGMFTKQEEPRDDTGAAAALRDISDEQPTSVGLVFAGSRLGDSSLLLYGLQEGVMLEPLVDNEEKEKESVKSEMVGGAVGKEEQKEEEEEEEKDLKLAANEEKEEAAEEEKKVHKIQEVPASEEDEVVAKRKKIEHETDEKDAASTIDEANAPSLSDDEQPDTKRQKKDEQPSSSSSSSSSIPPPDLQPTNTNEITTVSDDESPNNKHPPPLSYDEILRLEEEALYAPISPSSSSPSLQHHHQHCDDPTTTTLTNHQDNHNDESALLPGVPAKLIARPQITSMSIFRHFTALDSFTGLGPIGKGCTGTVASTLSSRMDDNASSAGLASSINTEEECCGGAVSIGGARTNIYPCGYGSSGGLAILTAPGIGYGGSIASEVDCRNVERVFSFENLGFVMMTRCCKGDGGEDGGGRGCILLRLLEEEEEEGKRETHLDEVDLHTFLSSSSLPPTDDDGDDPVVKMEVDNDQPQSAAAKPTTPPSLNNAWDVLTRMDIITAKEFPSNNSHNGDTQSTTTSLYHIMIMVRHGKDGIAIVILSHSSLSSEKEEEGVGENDGYHVTYSHVIGSRDTTKDDDDDDDDIILQDEQHNEEQQRRRRGDLVSVSVSEPLDNIQRNVSRAMVDSTTEDGDDKNDKVCVSLTCVWSSGNGSILTLSRNDAVGAGGWCVREVLMEGIAGDLTVTIDNYGSNKSGSGGGEEDDIGSKKMQDGTDQFYNTSRIVAMDIFTIADDIFQRNDDDDGNASSSPPVPLNSLVGSNNNYKMMGKDEIDLDDLELYGDEAVEIMRCLPPSSAQTDVNATTITTTAKQQIEPMSSSMAPSRYNTLAGYISGAGLSDTARDLVAVCRQNGQLQIFDVATLFSSNNVSTTMLSDDDKVLQSALLWSVTGGCGTGAPILTSTDVPVSNPTMHNVYTAEIRLFFSGPSSSSGGGPGGGLMATNNGRNPDDDTDLSILRSLCLLIETNLGDLHLYTASKSPTKNNVAFQRVSFGMPTRSSKAETNHRNKLRSAGILSDANKEGDSPASSFRPNRLHRFRCITGQDGLFAATARPLWILSERGAPTVLCHRLRHTAPAGVSPVPVHGFCSGLRVGQGGGGGGASSHAFLTLHDRIGRVGSQRLTLFNGLSDVFTPHGILPGGGICVQKVPLGVTVRSIKFIDDASLSSVSHPLFAILISKEIECDQSHLNDDGLTSDERRESKEEKEREKTRRQVEADLGGFEVEQEWVEEIEREDCFEVEKKYGSAPPIPGRVYEIWLVDAFGWNVIDTYPLKEWEHGIALEVMHLSEVSTEDSSNEKTSQDTRKEEETSLFLTVGTGIVDQDGEDVSSRGRILVFEIKRNTTSDIDDDNEDKNKVATINFIYEKDILLGPVTCLVCLTCENRRRLVVGAGAEITVEQWGEGKLTQVGFFHANMHVQDIVIFKTFLLLSDAYDSLHFLVWRESDKSLTLLAKDYEPTCVYAAGLLTRGGAVSFVCHDDRQNLSFFSYAPNDVAARGGNKLVCRGDFHLGAQTVSLESHFCRSSLLINSATIQSTLVALKLQDTSFGNLDDDQRFALHFGTTDGGFGSILPLNENVFWRLLALQSVMSNALETDCSLSQRAWRLYRRTPRRGGCKSNDRKKGVIDGDLVMKYTDLPLTEQENLASAIGSSVELVFDNLLEVACSRMVV